MLDLSIKDFKNVYNQQSATQKLEKAVNLKDSALSSDAKIEEVANEFEKMMFKMMFKEMTDSLESGGFFGSEAGADFYQDMYMDNITSMMSKNQSLGLSDMIVRQLKNDYSSMPKSGSKPILQKEVVINQDPIVQENISAVSPRTVRQPQVVEAPKTLMDRLTQYEPIIEKAANTYNLDKNLIKAVIAQESYGNAKATSPVGAKGLMQLMDGTARDLGVKNPYNPEENIMAGAKYLKQQLDTFKSKELALAAYNAGPGNVQKYDGIPPFKETQNYVRNVMRYFKSL